MILRVLANAKNPKFGEFNIEEEKGVDTFRPLHPNM